MLPENEKRNTKAILHGIGRALLSFNQDITEEPLPQALTEALEKLLERILRQKPVSEKQLDRALKGRGVTPPDARG